MMANFPFRFDGPVGRRRYAVWAFGVFLSQHVLVLLVSALAAPEHFKSLDWHFVLMPLRWFGVRWFVDVPPSWPAGVPTLLMVGAFLYHLLVAWMLLALSFRRAVEANMRPWIVGFAILPVLQIPALYVLSLKPCRDADAAEPATVLPERAVKWTTGAQGLAFGILLTLSAVFLSTLAFGSYGLGIFVITPFAVGMTTAMIANRDGDRGAVYTNRLVVNTVVLGALVLIGLAIEGVICLIMAAPLGVPMAWLGGLLGRAIALKGSSTPGRTLSSVSALPIVLIGEFLIAPVTSFTTVNTIVINAPPARVWQSLVSMDRIDAPPPLVFQLGMAYPTGATLVGEGAGAMRLGHFSTGTALERVTDWQPGRKLAFTVLSDIPAMDELSPYDHVHAPHAIGYFFTHETSFELIAEESGGTRLIERTSHSLKLEPAIYWLPLARFMVDQNNARVLAHIKRQSERVR